MPFSFKKEKNSKIFKEAIRIILLCICWYTTSACSNVVAKMVLNIFPYPTTLSLAHNATPLIFLGPLLKLWKVRQQTSIKKRYFFRTIIPLAIGKFLASVSSQFSIAKISLSYSHTVKASMPIFTVFLSRIIFKETQTFVVYLSLLPIVLGIVLATVTELSFDFIGLFCALFSTLNFSLQNIFCKKVMKDTNIHHLHLLKELNQICFIITIPFWMTFDLTRWNSNVLEKVDSPLRLILLILVDAIFNFTQNMVAFTVISLITPLSYSVANATKRVVVITVSIVAMRNPVNMSNIIGMSIAILGVLCYNKAKLEQSRRKLPETSILNDDVIKPKLMTSSDVKLKIDESAEGKLLSTTTLYRYV